MEINKVKFEQIVSEAKNKATGNARWVAAIEKAAEGILSGAWIVTELVDGLMITTENGTYHANGVCQCKAFEHGQPCKHRAAAKLIANYNETAPVAVSREELIADIKTTWSIKYPTEPLAAELMARFRCNNLTMLNTDFLRRVQAAIA